MLEVHNAGVRLSGRGWLFRHLNFSVQRGSLCTILGPNGSGKTTLMKALLGMEKLTEGQVRRPEHLGHVPQRLDVLFDFTVEDMVLMGRIRRVGLFAAPGRHDRAAVCAALAEVGMSAFAHRPFAILSGGERQLVLLARALASGAELILLDEPTAALDLANDARVMSVLAELKDRGTTVLMTTHDPDQAVQLADSVLLLGGPDGHRFGPSDQCLDDAALTRLYGVPLQRVAVETPQGRRSVLVKLHGRAAS